MKYEVWHRIISEFYLGEIEAKDKDIRKLPMSSENEEFIIEEIN